MTEKELLPFTPGPWSNKCNYIEANNDSIGLCFNINDSKLASLAPEMFKMLKELIKVAKTYTANYPAAYPTIEKAEQLVSQMYK